MKTKRRLFIAGIVLGAVMMLSPLVGLLGTAMGMQKAFNTLGSSGIGDPKALSGAIDDVIISTAVGLIFGLLGVVLFIVCIVCLVRLNNRKANHSAMK